MIPGDYGTSAQRGRRRWNTGVVAEPFYVNAGSVGSRRIVPRGGNLSPWHLSTLEGLYDLHAATTTWAGWWVVVVVAVVALLLIDSGSDREQLST